VENHVLGYQFVLPKVWKMTDPFGPIYVRARYSTEVTQEVTLVLTMQSAEGTLEDELLELKDQEIESFDDLQASVLTTNGYGTQLGYFRYTKFVRGSMHGFIYGEIYRILFKVDNIIVTITITKIPTYGHASLKLTATDLQAILAVQNSIRIK
jgi:hypothetical protein